MLRRDIAVPSWCECGKCCKTPKEDEDVCCLEKQCRSTSEEFAEFIETLTEKFLTEEECKNKFFDTLHESQEVREKAIAVYDALTNVGKLRRLCYWKTSSFFHQNSWYPQNGEDERYIALPSCIVWQIRRKYTEKEEGRYTGFPPKEELLQKVVDARETLKRDMNLYKTVVSAADPNGGLLSTLNKLKQYKNAVYDEILRRVDNETSMGDEANRSVDHQERWTEAIDRGVDFLPRLGFVACATAFEAFVHDAFKRCLETVFSTGRVSEINEKLWNSWLDSRAAESEGWTKSEHEDETRFWTQFEPTKTVNRTKQKRQKKIKKRQNHTVQKLQNYWRQIYRYVSGNATSQEAVGLVQEMVNFDIKRNIMHDELKPTMYSIQNKFNKLADYADNGKKDKTKDKDEKGRKRKENSSARSSKRQKKNISVIKEAEREEESSVSDSSMTSISSVSSRTSDSSYNLTKSPGQPMDTSTPARKSEQASLSETSTENAIKYLIGQYAKKYHWQTLAGPNHTSYDVKCDGGKSLEYLSSLFYGIRNILCHGTPEKILSGALRVDCIPQEPSDLNVLVAGGNQTDEGRCQSYLFDLFQEARTEFGKMSVDHDLFLAAQSFYEYSAEIVSRVAACMVYKYGNVNLREKVTHVDMQEMREIKEMVKRAWSSVDEATALSAGDQSIESQASDLSVHGTAGQSRTGITQDVSELDI